MNQRSSFLLALALSTVSIPAMGCGACIEDQIAATYDHEVMTQAVARHHVVVFAAVVRSASSKFDALELTRAAAASKGVVAASVRVSGEPSALSFALDAAVRGPERTLADIQTRLRATGIKLNLLRVAS